MTAPGGRLADKVALVTGAAAGIGAAVAARFAAEGAHVLLTDVDEDGVAERAAEVGGQAHRHDVTSEDDWAVVVDWALGLHERVDVLVNNAGVFLLASLADTSLEAFRRVQEVNQVGVFLGMRTVAPHMVAAGAGSIINLSSIAGLQGVQHLTAYAASKWAVRGMSRSVARELAGAGVRVNTLHPGQIDTEMNARQVAAAPDLLARLVRTIPARRIGQPDEVAAAAVYLASDESRYVTGTELVVDGGSSA